MDYRFLTADVFADRPFGGNPLAVLPDGRGLGDTQMQAIAKEFNLSETVFVLPPSDPAHTRRLRIFTPEIEMPFAGHPTVGAAYVLAEIGEIPLAGAETSIVFEEGVGSVPVTIRAEAGRPVSCELSTAVMPTFGPPPPSAADVAAILSLERGDIIDQPPIHAVSCGVPYLFVVVAGIDAVRRAHLRRDAWDALLANSWAPSVFVFSFETDSSDADVHARMFAPGAGVEEDPATGSAAAALAGYLGADDPLQDGTLRWVVEQGYEMGRPSRLEVEADKQDGAITAVRVAGCSVMVSQGTITVPED